jgi:sec-independent protein translocase protein TatB
MFDISFTEILVIGVVALVVLGPERLPGVARTLGHLFGRAQRYVNDVKNDIQREMELEELKKFKTSVEGTAHSIETAVRNEIRQFQEATNAGETSASGSAVSPHAETMMQRPVPADSPVTSANEVNSPSAQLPAQSRTGSGAAGTHHANN